MNEIDVLKKLKGYIYAEHGSLRKFAKSTGFSVSYISAMLSGKKPVTNEILAHIGMKKITQIAYVQA